jgi:hypothetical protein
MNHSRLRSERESPFLGQLGSSTLETDSEPTSIRDQTASNRPSEIPTSSDIDHEQNSDGACCRGNPEKRGPHPLEWAIGIMLFFTLIATSCAAKFTHDQAVTADDTEKRSLRAYVGVFTHKIQNVAIKGAPHVEIAIKNFGNTPATNVVYWIFSKFDNYPDPTTLAIQDFRPDKIVLFPTDGFTTTFDIGALDQIDMDGLANSRWLYAYGEIDYLDAFEKKRCTKFRLMYGGQLLKLERMAIAGNGNEIDKACQS